MKGSRKVASELVTTQSAEEPSDCDSDGRAVHSDHDWLSHVGNRVEERRHGIVRRLRPLAERVQVVAGAEVISSASDQDAAHVVSRIGKAQGLGERTEHGKRDRIALFLAIDIDVPDSASQRGQDEIVLLFPYIHAHSDKVLRD